MPRLIVLAVCLALSGCGSAAGPRPPLDVIADHPAALRLVVSGAVTAVLIAHPELTPVVALVARQAQQAMRGDITAGEIAPLVQRVLDQVPALAPDRVVLDELGALVLQEVHGYITRQGLQGQQVVLVVGQVLDAVALAAEVRLPRRTGG